MVAGRRARAVGAAALRFAAALGCSLAVAACSDAARDDERCEADDTLAEVCARAGDCPEDLSSAITRGKACDAGGFYEMWRDGDRRAIGVSSGYAGKIYQFQGAQLVGIHSWTDQLEGDCPSDFVNGKLALSVPVYVYGTEPTTVEYCVLCPEWQVDDRPLCTAEQVGEPR